MDSAPSLKLREKHKLQTKIAIIRAGLDLFAEHGFENVPVEMICERAGISRATFFNYFAQKDMILAEFAVERLERAQQAMLRQARTCDASLQDVLNLFLEFAKDNERLGPDGKHVLSAMLSRPGCRAANAELRKGLLKTVTIMIQRAREADDIRYAGYSAREMAEMIFALYVGTSLEWLILTNAPGSWLTKQLRRRFDMALSWILGPAAAKRRRR